MNFLLQPKKYKSLMADEGSKAIMSKTIAFFEKMGKTRLLDEYNKKIWYREFVDFVGKPAKERLGQRDGYDLDRENESHRLRAEPGVF